MPSTLPFAQSLDVYLSLLIWVISIPVGLYAFVHALTQRADAFTAVDKLTKPAWCGITGVGVLFLLIGGGPRGGFTILWLVALCAVLVYLLDVRPRVIEVQQGGGRW